MSSSTHPEQANNAPLGEPRQTRLCDFLEDGEVVYAQPAIRVTLVGGRGETRRTGCLAPASELSDQPSAVTDDRQARYMEIRRCLRLREFLVRQGPPGVSGLVGLPVQASHSRTCLHTCQGTSRTCRTRRKESGSKRSPHIAPRHAAFNSPPPPPGSDRTPRAQNRSRVTPHGFAR